MGKKSDIGHRSVYFEYYKYVAKYGYLYKWEECVTKTCYNLSIGGEFDTLMGWIKMHYFRGLL